LVGDSDLLVLGPISVDEEAKAGKEVTREWDNKRNVIQAANKGVNV
jgi:hypothetical protein